MIKLKVLIADDHILLADGLGMALALEADLDVVGVFHSGEEACAGSMLLEPAVVLLDIQMPDGLQCLKQIKTDRPETVVLVLTTLCEGDLILDVLASGASGIVLKDIRMGDLIDIIRHAVQGYMMLPTPIAARVAEATALLRPAPGDRKGGGREKSQLSAREREVAALLMQGLPNRVIAERLNISRGTSKNYISTIYGKLNTSDRLQAIALLRQQLDLV